MPTPVSLTSKRTPAFPKPTSPGDADANFTPPRSVNLMALPRRLSSTCFNRCASPITQLADRSDRDPVQDSDPCPSAVARGTDALTDVANPCKDIGPCARFNLPASIFEWSRTSFRISMSELPEVAAVLTRLSLAFVQVRMA